MNRRSFLAGILAASVAPAIVRAASLMPMRVLDSGLAVPLNFVGDRGVEIVNLPRIWADGVALKSHTLIAPLKCRELIVEAGATLIIGGQMVYVMDTLTNLGTMEI